MTATKTPNGMKAARIKAMLDAYPHLTDNEIASKVGCHFTYVFKLRKEANVPEVPPVEMSDGGRVVPIKPAPKPAPKAAADGITQVLEERGSRYGNFLDHARITYRLKNVAHGFAAEKGKIFDPDQAEALDMIFHKIGRILNGDPNYADSWVDIAGYAKLVADRLEGKVR